MKGVKATAWSSPLSPGDSDPRHGLNGYSNLGCRCEDCRRAWADEQAAAREWRRSRPLPDGVEHGLYSTYTNYRCKCATCRKANTDYARDYRRKKQTT